MEITANDVLLGEGTMLVLVNFVQFFFGKELKEKFTWTDTVEREQTGLIFHLKSEIQKLGFKLGFHERWGNNFFFDREFLAPLAVLKVTFFLKN